MDIHTDYMEPVTPALNYDNVSFWRTEDSGYQTSFTPGSVECSEISSENLDPSLVDNQICITGQIKVGCYKLRVGRKYIRSKTSNTGILTENNFCESPISRRGIKRPYQECSPDVTSQIQTPTSIIAGGIQKMRVNDNTLLSASVSVSSFGSCQDFYDFPSTPIKRICKTSCMLSPSSLQKSTKKLNFSIHSLSCEKQGLQQTTKSKVPTNNVSSFRPGEKVDIIKMLYKKTCAMPAIMKIFSYLSNADIYNVSLVSPMWLEVWEQVSKTKQKKQEFLNFLKNTKDDIENSNKETAPKQNLNSERKSLKEVHNLLNINNQQSNNSHISPPGTPRTMRFKKFTKSASLDSRIQLSCVRCCQPAKVTEEVTGEEWAECTSPLCSYQFCRFCNCVRHPGKVCFQFDLDGPSPSKRKKSKEICAVGTKKSRKNLRRLLCN